MYEAYKDSIEIVKSLNRRLTKKEYSKLAKTYNLLNVVSLEFMANKKFNEIMEDIIL